MDKKIALDALAALAQETRLDAFRLLVGAGEDGIAAGEIAGQLGIVQNTMSNHLAILAQAGLVERERNGRSQTYFADIEAMQSLLNYLMTDCCGGRPELCAPAIGSLGSDHSQTKEVRGD